MQKHICSVKVFKTVRERTVAPTARLLALQLMSPMRRASKGG